MLLALASRPHPPRHVCVHPPPLPVCLSVCLSAQSLFSIFGSASSFFAHLLYSSAGGSPTGQFRLLCLGLVLLCVPAIEVS